MEKNQEKTFDKQTKVLFISARADHGGGPKHLEQILQNLKGIIQCKVACPKDEPYWKRIIAEIGQDNVIEIPHRKFSIGHLIKLVRYIKKHQINIVHSHGKGAGLYSRLLRVFIKIRVIHTFHGIHIGQYGKIKRWLYLKLERWLSLITDRVICVSRSEANTVLRFNISKTNKIAIIENGVVVPKLQQRTMPQQFDVVSISRFEFQKNSELIIPILENLRLKGCLYGFKFLLIGDGPNRKRLLDEVQRRGFKKSVEFVGHVSSPDKYLKGAFCYLSTSRWEGLPISLLEALAWALPIVATDVEGNIDLVKDSQNGFLYPINDPEKASSSLLKLSQSPDLWQAMSELSYQFCKEHYDVKRQCEKILELYLAVVN